MRPAFKLRFAASGDDGTMGAMHECLMSGRLAGGHAGRRTPWLVVFLAVCISLVATAGCDSSAQARTIRITSAPVNVTGLFARVEYLRDGKVVNAVHLIDGNGDGVVDGKSGPKDDGNWPDGWQWFDAMYQDATVGQTTVAFDGQKVTVTAGNTYEFIVGEYECGGTR